MSRWLDERSFATARASAWILSAVAGYVDSAGFLALFGLFPSHVTGDIVSLGAVVADGAQKVGLYSRIAMLPLFMAAVATATFAARKAKAAGMNPLLPLLLLLTIGLAVFCGTGCVFSKLVDEPDAWAVVVVAGAGVTAMGIQNTLMREALHGLVPTTVMTGNLTQFTINLVDMLLCSQARCPVERKRAQREAWTRLLNFGLPLLGFFVGVALGGYLTSKVGLLSIALPTVIVAVLGMSIARQETAARSESSSAEAAAAAAAAEAQAV